MLKKTLIAMLAMLLGGFAVQTNAALVSFWSFDDSAGTTIDTTAESGSGILSLTKADVGNIIQAGSSTILNDPRPLPTATPSVQFLNTSGGLHTYTILVEVTGTAGLSDWVLTYAARESPASANVDQQWAWSTTSGITGFTDITSPGEPGTGFATQTADFSGVGTLDGFAASIWFRNTFTVDGDARFFEFDNLQVTAVPEPINVALACFGLAFVGLTFGRRIYSMARGPQTVTA